MALEAPLFIGPRLMAAVNVGDDGGTLHIEPLRRDSEDRVVWRYVIENGDRHELADAADLRSGSGDNIDPTKAMGTLVTFLGTAAESYRRTMEGQQTEHADLFAPEVMEWAYLQEDELTVLALDLEEPEVSNPVRRPGGPYLRPAGGAEDVPPGWTADPVGEWNGQETEVVYNPRLHDVMVVPSTKTEDREGDLAAAGWSYEGTDGYVVMWVLDRAAAARAPLNRAPSPPPPEIGGVGL